MILSTLCQTYTRYFFAGDGVLFMTGFDLNNLLLNFNYNLIMLHDWLLFNRLTLNVSKTKYMIFTVKKLHEHRNLIINEACLECVKQFKYLGLILRDDLSFNDHINFICSKISRIHGLSRVIKSLLGPEGLKSLYFSLVYPHLLLHNIIWGGASATILSKLQRIQNKVIRNILPNSLNLHTNEIFIHLKILNIAKISKYQSLLFLYKWAFCNYYQYLPIRFENFRFDHGYDVRRSHLLRLPFARTENHRRSVWFRAISEWNSLPDQVRDSETRSP